MKILSLKPAVSKSQRSTCEHKNAQSPSSRNSVKSDQLIFYVKFTLSAWAQKEIFLSTSIDAIHLNKNIQNILFDNKYTYAYCRVLVLVALAQVSAS